MPQRCKVCAHPSRKAIDQAIVSPAPNREVALRHGLTEMAVSRHGRNHIRETLLKATEATVVAHADDLLTKIRGYIREAEGIMREATTESDRKLALQAMDRAMSGVTLLARIGGEIDERSNVNVLVASPDWTRLRTRLIEALRPYPDALASVAEAMREVS